MRLEQLETYITLAESGSMNMAAERLYTSQQNISKTIKSLEEEYGCEFFIRSKKGVTLTPQGEWMYQFAKKQQADFAAAKNEIDHVLTRNLSGTLSIAVTSSGSSMVLPQFLCSCYKDYSNVEVKITDTKLGTVMRNVQLGTADFGIVSCVSNHGTLIPAIPDDLEFVPLMRGAAYFWVGANSKYAKQGFITFEEANDATVLVDNAIDMELLAKLFAARGQVLRVSANSKSLPLLARMIADGQGVFPDSYLEEYEGHFLYQYVFGNRRDLTPVPIVEGQQIRMEIGYIIKKGIKQPFLVEHALDSLKTNNQYS